jgi:hypothetical protein
LKQNCTTLYPHCHVWSWSPLTFLYDWITG